MVAYKRSPVDRRGAEERRQIYFIDYFDGGGRERRFQSEPRCCIEKRKGWVCIDKQMSISLDWLGASKNLY